MINNRNIHAIIPARGGSKGIPKKNILNFDGIPLIAHSINYAKESEFIDSILVSTDSKDIAKIATEYGANIINRPDSISGDNASTELAINHVIEVMNIDKDSIIILLQPTSPIRPNGILDKMLDKFILENYDSMVSLSPCHPLSWKLNADSAICQYDYKNRPMRQQFKKDDLLYDENGSVYIFTQSLFINQKNRLGGKIGYEIFPEEFGRQLDTYLDLEILKSITKYINMKGNDE